MGASHEAFYDRGCHSRGVTKERAGRQSLWSVFCPSGLARGSYRDENEANARKSFSCDCDVLPTL